MLRATRLLLGFVRSAPPFREEDVLIPDFGGERPATLYRPRGTGRSPGWVLLPGLTVYGRRHPSMLRFASALSSTGATVLIPEVPAWTRLEMRPLEVVEAIAAGGAYLRGLSSVRSGGVGVIGFSFGATQALLAATDERSRQHMRLIVGFGGYCELMRLARFMITGEHEWRGRRFQLDPDPYARWIVAGNYLASVAGFEEMRRVQAAMLELAIESGRGGVFKPDSYVDPLKDTIRTRLEGEERRIFDLLAPPAGQRPADLEAAAEIGRVTALAALADEPLLDPLPQLRRVRTPVVLAHGLHDRLIPFTETLRLAEKLRPSVATSVTITPLFQHSSSSNQLQPLRYAYEALRLLRLFNEVLRR